MYPPSPFGRLSAALTLAFASACLVPTASAEVRTMIVTSDPQYPWTSKTDAKLPESDAQTQAESERLIEEQYRSIAAYRAARPDQQIPVFINGDLTAYGHGWQRAVMERMYRILGDNVHLGLGNHDYANNIREADGSGCYNNGCARDSINDLVRHVRNKRSTVAFDFADMSQGLFKKSYYGSLGYAVETPGLERVLNVQLNYHPTYTVSFDTTEKLRPAHYEIVSSLPWLDGLLDTHLSVPRYGTPADRAYDFAILHMHDPLEDAWELEGLPDREHIAAIFGGHIHALMGRYPNENGIPIFLSGSASQRTYLVVEHDTDAAVLRVYGVYRNDPERKQLLSVVPVPTS